MRNLSYEGGLDNQQNLFNNLQVPAKLGGDNSRVEGICVDPRALTFARQLPREQHVGQLGLTVRLPGLKLKNATFFMSR